MSLTQKQKNFCAEYVKCGNAAEAYRRAYRAEKMKPATVQNNAYKLMCNNEIATMLQSLRDAAAKEAQVTLEGHLNKLAELRDMAIAEGQLSAAITAEVSRGKAAGLYTDKVKAEVSGANGGPLSSEIVVKFVEPERHDG